MITTYTLLHMSVGERYITVDILITHKIPGAAEHYNSGFDGHFLHENWRPTYYSIYDIGHEFLLK